MGRTEEFYNGVLGLPIAARLGTNMTFFTLGNHHDLTVLEVGSDAPDAPADAPGLYYIKVGTSIDGLRAVKSELEDAAVVVDHASDHTVPQSLCLQDPDGKGVELYVEVSDVWSADPQRSPPSLYCRSDVLRRAG